MKKRVLYMLLAVAIAVIGVFRLEGNVVFAETNIRDTDVVEPSTGNDIVLLEGTFNYLPKEEILKRINEIRYEACVEGVRDPENPSRSLTKSDYVPIRWSSDLEWIAQTRAAEATVHMDHKRPNGKQWSGVAHNGVSSNAEDLAWNYSADIIDGINQWYEEKSDWINNVSGAVTGHYTSMIDTQYRYVGIGAFKPSDGIGAVAGEMKISGSLDESQTGAQGEYLQKVEVRKGKLSVEAPDSLDIHIGKTEALTIIARTSYANDLGSWWSPKVSDVMLIGTAEYSSSDESVVTVDDTGILEGVKDGTATITTSYNGSDYKTVIRVSDHSWNEVIVREPTCTEKGLKTFSCRGCEATRTEEIPADPNAHSFDELIRRVDATCLKDGREAYYRCSLCGKLFVEEGNKYIEKTESELIIPKGHRLSRTAPGNATCSKPGNTEYWHCSLCNKYFSDANGMAEIDPASVVIEMTGHNFSDWAVSSGPTEAASGVRTRSCSVCGRTETESIPALAPTLRKVRIAKPTAAKKSMKVKWKKLKKADLKKIRSIEIQYSRDRGFRSGVITGYTSAKKTSKKIKGLTKGTRYYVRIRACNRTGVTEHVSAWSSVKSVKIK